MLSNDIARAILDGFDHHYRLFRNISVAARACFERADWNAVRDAQRARIGMYDLRVEETVRTIAAQFPTTGDEEALWRRVKVDYIGLLYEATHHQPECAETFFNSVARRLLHRRYFNNNCIFDRPVISTEHLDGNEPAYLSFYPQSADLTESFRAVLQSFGLKNEFQDLERDLGYVRRALAEQYPNGWTPRPNFQIQVLRSLFFRNKSAYVVARVLNGAEIIPVVVPLLQDDERRIYVDTVLFDAANVGRVFSLGRSYFMVDMEVPSAYVDFIASIAPAKPRNELYTLVGLQKQGKTLIFRDLQHHLRHSSDIFVLAPGTKGMVMLVFTLPSFPYVFKVIRDTFEPPKNVDRDVVEAKYAFVKRHDRAGRLADTLEFSHVAFPTERLDPALLRELERLAPSQIARTKTSALGTSSDYVVIRHLYIERRLVPLNLYLENADDAKAREALREYGQAIRDLAGANVFPGDLLLKNFGVTRYGRVVFYDYDELAELTECRFRKLPRAHDDAEELSAEPWFSVREGDVFPEQFPTFLIPPGRLRDMFMELDGDLADPDFWTAQQERVRAGLMPDLFPYSEALRFSKRFASGSKPAPPSV